MARKDPRDATSREGTPPAADGDAYAKTIGLPVEFYKDLSPETAALAARTAAAFEDLGWRVREMSLPSYHYGVAAYYLLSSAEAASNLSPVSYTHLSPDAYDGMRMSGHILCQYGWHRRNFTLLSLLEGTGAFFAV